MSETVKLGVIRRHTGIAGQVSYSVPVTYSGEETSTVTFVGSAVYGGPVVMVTPSGVQTFVTDPNRFGKFGATWVRRFFSATACEAPGNNHSDDVVVVYSGRGEPRTFCGYHESRR